MADVFDMIDVLDTLRESDQPYYEFLQRPSLSVGLYHLAASEPDRQNPHTEDEIYYVLAGEGRIDIEGDISPIRPGSVIYVAKNVPHRFLDHAEGITLLVIFAPARGRTVGAE